MGPDALIFIFWMSSFRPTFSLSTFTFIKRLFSSSSLSAIRVVSSAYLRLLIFLPAILDVSKMKRYKHYPWNKRFWIIAPHKQQNAKVKASESGLHLLTLTGKKITALIQNALERSSAVLSNPIVLVAYAHLCPVCSEKGCECKKHSRCQRLDTRKKCKISWQLSHID